jgi:hypothetical protein
MRSTFIAAIASSLLGFASSASAVPAFLVSGGTSFTLAGNDFQWIGSPVTEGATLGLSEAGLVTAEFIGKEAGFASTLFRWGSLSGGTTLFDTGAGGTVGQTGLAPLPPAALAGPVSFAANAGTLLFNFLVAATGGVVENGQGTGTAADSIAFWSRSGANGASVIYVLLDDGGSTDADFDDMIIRLSVSALPPDDVVSTPAPGTLLMLVAGLGVMGFITRRRLHSASR